MSGSISIDGLVTGFSTSEMIDKIMAVERRGVTLLEARQARANTQLAAFRALNSKLLSVLSSARTLARSTSFGAKSISVSDETILTASGGIGAAPGTYAVTVNALARNHQLASQGYADSDSTTVGTGTIQLQVGDGETVTVTIDGTNNTLAGVRAAINDADAGVAASILNDGSDAVPYRLLLTANETGADNTISVTTSLSGGTGTIPSWVDSVVPDPGNGYTGAATSGGTYTGGSDKTYTIEITKGGDLSQARYKVSEDGGSTWGSTIDFNGAATIDVFDDLSSTDFGVDVTFENVDFTVNDVFTVDAHAEVTYPIPAEAPVFDATSISDVVADAANTYAGTATSGGTYTGNGNASYLVEIVAGGDLATATYRVSEDGGTTWGSTLALAGGTIDVYDDVHGSDLGVDATFADDTFGAGDRFLIDAFVPTVQEAADAELVVGSGAGQITIASASNTVADALPGLTLTLASADPSESVAIEVASDTAAIQRNVQAFVDSYNGVADFIREQTRYDPETDVAGILLGNTAVMKIQQDLRGALLGTVPGLAAGQNGLYAIGISVSSTGSLSLDSSELAAALEENLDAVARLFQSSGESTHSKIAFVAATGDTESTTAGYEVVVTQAASRGTLTGTSIADPAIGGLTIDATNDKLALSINGVATGILSLTQKTYTSGAELAAEIAAKIDASAAGAADVEVVFVDEGATGYFELRTGDYGAGQSVELADSPSNNATTALGLADGTATAGTNVAGTIDGLAAEGTGRVLKATSANSSAEGLSVLVSLDADEIGGGVSALVTVVKGVAKQAQDLLDYLTDPVDGYVKGKEDRFLSQVESYSDQIERREELLVLRRQRMVERFARLETAISSIRNQGEFLSSQLAALASLRSSYS